eukprot:TRINITY_DN3627_c0_g1_i1.p1 TRINITY_DN3627_c0_g1~~TRINITY_DN3627_c0_g1_i1.p1  ORF type:complete len:920 (-),score=386.33 TRINITY_DN3627_c0_g1_i1:339-3098(-)
MGLLPLEFSDCILDSPYFRENLRAHEKELDRTSSEMKGIIKDIQDVVEAAKLLSKAKRTLGKSLASFRFDCIGSYLTDDEIVISNSLKEFARFLSLVEEEMDRMLEHSYEKFIVPLVNFRKEQIGSVRKTKKEFDKCTTKSCSVQDRYINLSSKREESLSEASEAVRLEAKNLQSSSLEYVYLLQVVQERKKFEFAESVLCFVRSWANYYEHGHSVGLDFSKYVEDLKTRIQKSRENYSITIERYDTFKRSMLDRIDPGVFNKMYTRQGYLYACKKSKLGGYAWLKLYCQYQAKTKILTMIPYNQLNGKITTTETVRVSSCTCKEEPLEKFRFVVMGEDVNESGGGSSGSSSPMSYTFQALTDWERKQWVEALGGTWPAVNTLQRIRADSVEDNLNSMAFTFLKDCLSELERRGLKDEGLYRVGGVVSKVKHLLNSGLDPQLGENPLVLSDAKLWESKTLASAVKQYFRDLNKPLMTHHCYSAFIEAVKRDSEEERICEIRGILRRLPHSNQEILKVLIKHLHRVSLKNEFNLMTAANLGVCFGPTLLRPREESVASIMDIKFCNEVIEILIENCESFFAFEPGSSGENESQKNNGYRKCSVPEEILSRNARGNSVPKRTHSFSSFSQISTNSLPDIKEFGSPESKVGSRLTEEEEYNSPHCAPKSKNEDLMASLELMTSLAADLPNNSFSTLKRSWTVNDKKINKKPPLPKVSLLSPILLSNKLHGESRRVRKISYPAIVVPTVVTIPPNRSPVSSLSATSIPEDVHEKSSDLISVESSSSSMTTNSGSKYDNMRFDDLRSRDGDDENDDSEEEMTDDYSLAEEDEEVDKQILFADSGGDSISDDSNSLKRNSFLRRNKRRTPGIFLESGGDRRLRKTSSCSSNTNEDFELDKKGTHQKQTQLTFLQKMLSTGQTTDV